MAIHASVQHGRISLASAPQDKADAFRDQRHVGIERLRSGEQSMFPRETKDAVGTTKIHATEDASVVLKPPPDAFLPMSLYKKEFGKVILVKKRHRKLTHQGIEGVVVPITQIPPGGVPGMWTLERQLSTGTSKSTLVHSEDKGDDDVGESMAEAAFAAQRERVMNASSTDLMKSLLMRAASTSSGSPHP
jgi:hypothetical protein